MSKIAKEYIIAATKLRKEWLENSLHLTSLQTELEQFNESIQTILSKIESMRESDNESDLTSVKLNAVLSELEETENKLTNSIKPITEKNEQLKKELAILWEAIKARYPELSEDEIQIEVAKELNINI